MANESEIVNAVLMFLMGFIYVRSRVEGNRTYWDCKKVRNNECKARAITNLMGGKVSIVKGPDVSKHAHPSNREECDEEKIRMNLKRKAQFHPEEPPPRQECCETNWQKCHQEYSANSQREKV